MARRRAARAARPTRAARRPTPRSRARRRPRVLLGVLVLLAVVAGVFAAARGPVERQVVYPVHHADAVRDAASRHGLAPALVCAVIKCESGWDEGAVSAVGAQGLMQVMPATAESLVELGLVDAGAYDPSDLLDPATNIEYGCAYLEFLEKNLSSPDEVVAAYNAGIGTVQGWLENGPVPGSVEYPETRAYLERVSEAYEGYLRAYPEGVV